MIYKETTPTSIKEAVWNEKFCERAQAGKTIDTTDVPNLEYLPKGAPLGVSNGKYVLVHTAKVHAEAAAEAVAIQVEKGHTLAVGDTVAGSAISAITAGTDYDTLTVAALSAKVSKDTILDNGVVCVGLNYATVKLEGTPSAVHTIQAYEIEEDTLPYPINATIKSALTDRHQFV